MAHATRIFVSHSLQDAEWVRAFVEALRWMGCDVWYDGLGGGAPEETASPGTSPEVERELHARGLFIAVLTPTALHSARLRTEVELARALCAGDATRQALLIAAQPCRIPEPWRDSQVLGEGGGLVPEEAVRRVREVLDMLALRTRAAPALAALPAAPATAKHACERGRELRTQGRLEEALAAYDQALTLDAVSPVAWCGRGSVLLHLGRHGDAAGAFTQAMVYDPLLASAWQGAGDAFAALGDHERAVEAYERTIALDPHHASTWVAFGDALLRLDRYAQAAEAYEHALALAERNPRIWRRRGDALQQLARQQTRPGSRRTTLGPASASRDERLFADALAAYDRALALEPRYLRAWNHKIHLLDDLGRVAEAARARRERARALRSAASRDS